MNNLNPESYDRMYTYREDRIVRGQSMHWDIPLEQRPMPRLQSQQREVFLVRASLFFINSIATMRLLKQAGKRTKKIDEIRRLSSSNKSVRGSKMSRRGSPSLSLLSLRELQTGSPPLGAHIANCIVQQTTAYLLCSESQEHG